MYGANDCKEIAIEVACIAMIEAMMNDSTDETSVGPKTMKF